MGLRTSSAINSTLGLVYYELLCGRSPFDFVVGEAWDVTRRRVLEGQLMIRTDVPQAIERIVQKMVAKKRSKRFSSMHEAVLAISEIL